MIILKMNKGNSIETLNKFLDLVDQTKFRLNKTNEFKDSFNSEIWERKAINKKLSKYIAGFDYIEKTSIVLSATTRRISIISFTSIIGVPIGITSVSFSLVFSLETGIVKKRLVITRNKKKKHNKIVILAQSRLNIIETLISQRSWN